MRVGRGETVTVRISRQALQAAIYTGLQGRGVPQTEQLVTGAFMRVNLFGSGFTVTARSNSDQFVPATGFAEWLFDVLPVSGGEQTLTLQVAVRYKLPGGEEVTYQPVLTRDIAVEVDYWWQLSQFVSDNWQYFASGAGGLVLAVGGFFGKRWFDARDKKSGVPRRKRS